MYGCTNWGAGSKSYCMVALTGALGVKANWDQHKDAASLSEQILEAAPHKKAIASHLKKPFKKNKQEMMATAEEEKTNLSTKFSCGLQPMDSSLLTNQQNLYSKVLYRHRIPFGESAKKDGLREREREREREGEREGNPCYFMT